MTVVTSAQSTPLVSDDRLRDALRRELNRAFNIERTFTRQQLAEESGVNIHTLDAIMAREPAKHRPVNGGVALSLAVVLGKRCVNVILGTIGYQGAPLDEADEMQPCAVVGDVARGLAVIAAAASDNRFDHTELPGVTEAADLIIETVFPLSRAGRSLRT